MRGRRLFSGLSAGLFMIVLILDNQTALEGAYQAVKLCIQTVIPTMLPFLFLSTYLCAACCGQRLTLLRPMASLMGIPQGMEALLIPGLIGGYPLGAKAISDNYRCGLLTRDTAVRLLFFLSNAGPAFFIGILSFSFPERWMCFALWGIHILCAILIAAIAPLKEVSAAKMKEAELSLPQVMESSLKALGLICGWILCFRVLSSEMEKWLLWRFPSWLQALMIGLLELTYGCSKLTAISSVELRFLLAAGLSGFGGLCILMQTKSILGDLPLSPYLLGKTLQAVLSVLMACSVITGSFFLLVIILFGFTGMLMQNRGRKILRSGV